MNAILNRIILLNIELEGALRVAANRPSVEAIENAKRKFAEISALFAMLNPNEIVEETQTDRTELKYLEAESGEETPAAEPEVDPGYTVDDILVSETEEPKPERVVRDIRKMFTLNDKFLFKRELFNNNDSEFNDTLSLMSSMTSLDEVEEYVFEDMRWDPNDKIVRAFINVIAKYFA